MFAAKLMAGRFPVSLEITPPQRPLDRVLLRRASLLGPRANAVNVIQRPDRQSSLDASLTLRAAGLDPAWHLATRGRSSADVAANLERAASAGIGLVLALLGDHDAPPSSDGLTIRQAIAMARAALPSALVGATLNQYAAGQDAAFRNLLPKLEAGAAYVQTQPVFDLARFEEAARRLRREAPHVRIVPMVMPLPTVEAADRIAGRLGVTIPDEIRLAPDPWLAFEDIVRWLRSSGLANGLAIMTFEMDPPPATGERILAALRAAGVIEDGESPPESK